MLRDLQMKFDKLQEIRNFYFESEAFNDDINKRVLDDKWSIGESIYHCYLLLRITRIAVEWYVPVARVVMKLPFGIRRDEDMDNIYAGEVMKAPFVLVPPAERKFSKGELRLLLEKETSRIYEMLYTLTEREVFGIRLPDPIPNFPNIFQTVKLLHIHEAHHYEVVTCRCDRVIENQGG